MFVRQSFYDSVISRSLSDILIVVLNMTRKFSHPIASEQKIDKAAENIHLGATIYETN